MGLNRPRFSQCRRLSILDILCPSPPRIWDGRIHMIDAKALDAPARSFLKCFVWNHIYENK